MTGTGLPELAAAVSRAGGLGIVAIHNFGTTEEACRAGIRKTRELCQGKPFGVNLTILPAARPPPYDMYMRVMVEEGVKVAETVSASVIFVPRPANHEYSTFGHLPKGRF